MDRAWGIAEPEWLSTRKKQPLLALSCNNRFVTETAKRHYDNPPLEEAIFELFVPPSAPWSGSPTQAEDLAKRLSSYSGRREDLEDFNVYFQLGPGKSVAQGVNPVARRTRLWNERQTRAVQFGAEMCTHNVRRPYGHFEDHVDAIRDLFEAYLAVMKPPQLGWVGQRYLNIVRLPPDSPPRPTSRCTPISLPSSRQGTGRLRCRWRRPSSSAGAPS